MREENIFKGRLEKNQTKSAYVTALSLIEIDIQELSIKKTNFSVNEHFEVDLVELNNLKYQINKTSSDLSSLNIKKSLILEAEQELAASQSIIDLAQLRSIYQQAASNIAGIQKTFDDLVEYHNSMVGEKIKFIVKELPGIEASIRAKSLYLRELLDKEKAQAITISKSESFEELEQLIGELNEKFRKKGEYESTIQQLNVIDGEIRELNTQLEAIDGALFSDDFESQVKRQLAKFNKHFAHISNVLYGEQYALKHDIITNQKGQRLYKFSAFNTNFSSGKKQGEISCFDIAYTLFADEESLPTLHFLLNDKKELMHDNQLLKIAELANRTNIQFVASILKDKLPDELNKENYIIARLSQNDKLFRIEQN